MWRDRADGTNIRRACRRTPEEDIIIRILSQRRRAPPCPSALRIRLAQQREPLAPAASAIFRLNSRLNRQTTHRHRLGRHL